MSDEGTVMELEQRGWVRWSYSSKQLETLCQEDAQGRHAVREMKEDPSVPSYRGRRQTAMSCFG
jgi:hypothetical protein